MRSGSLLRPMTECGGGNGVGWDSDILCDSIWLFFVDAGRIGMVMNADDASPQRVIIMY